MCDFLVNLDFFLLKVEKCVCLISLFWGGTIHCPHTTLQGWKRTPLALGLLPGGHVSRSDVLALGNSLFGVLCNEQWQSSWVTR